MVLAFRPGKMYLQVPLGPPVGRTSGVLKEGFRAGRIIWAQKLRINDPVSSGGRGQF